MTKAKLTPYPPTVPDHYVPVPNLRFVSERLQQLWVPRDSWVMHPQDFHLYGIWADVAEEKNP